MRSKECNSSKQTTRWVIAVAVIAAAWPAACSADSVQTVRLWPTAVVVGEQIRLGELCELSGFEAETLKRLRSVEIAVAPPPGGSKAISLAELRDALANAGVNPATTIVMGAAECGVRRPSVEPAMPAGIVPAAADGQAAAPATNAVTLRSTVEAFFEEEFEPYGGRVQVDFSRQADPALDLTGPEFEFQVRRRSNRTLGLVDLEVDVLRGGQQVQRVQLQPIVAFFKRVVVARRAINQGAEIRPQDVHIVEMAFDRLNRLGLDDLHGAIGQRARRFIRPASVIQITELESVPLVKRGQLVTVRSKSGPIVVETVAKALEDGGYGDTIELRDTKRGRRRLLAVVTGTRQVEMRSRTAQSNDEGDVRLASAGGAS